MSCTEQTFLIIMYVLGCILLLALIVFVIKMIKTLSKVDKTIDDINQKSAKLDGMFDLVDKSADVLNTVSDTAVNYVTGWFLKLVNRKKNKEGDDINE